MPKYYINGNQVATEYARARFTGFHARVNQIELDEIKSMWAQCQISEEARDEWLPDNLEIIAD